MKNEHFMLALIVPGRRQVKNMDVYLQPLVDELNELWEGIHVYDVSRPIEQRGVLRCMEYVLTPHMIIQDFDFLW
jgi:hypothetical protein